MPVFHCVTKPLPLRLISQGGKRHDKRKYVPVMSRSWEQIISLQSSISARLVEFVAARILVLSSSQLPTPVPSSHVDGISLGCREGDELGSALGNSDGEELGNELGSRDGIVEGNELGPCEGCLRAQGFKEMKRSRGKCS